MEVICCAKTTRLLSFPDLNPIASYQHPDKNVSSDINYFQSNCFQQIFKTPDSKAHNLEFVMLKNDDNGSKKIEKLFRICLGSLSAAACAKNDSMGYAAGLSCGAIKLFSLRKPSIHHHKFIGDPSQKAAVQFLDYNIGNEYLASVYENGTIDIFGLKTKIKFHTITLDKNSVVAKFNPAKRFHLNIASYGGAVTVYDIQSKKIYFQQKDAHSAPCRDIAVPLEIPDRLMSVGFDSTIKIFDTRYKRTGLSIESSCPFSTINTTHCGGYFVVGNLKGEVISYDLRNIKSHLASFRAEDSAINRVLIVPNSAYTEKDISMMSQQSNSPKVPLNQEPLPATSNLNSDYLFMEEVIGHQRRISDFSTNFQSRVSSTSNRGSTSSRISDNFEMQFIGNMLNDLSGDLNDNDTKTESLSKTLDVSFINADRLKRRSIRSFDISEKSRLLSRKSATGPNLENINEEVTTASENDKENNSLTLNSKSKKEEDFRKQPMEDNPNIKIINATIPEQTQEKNEIVGDNISDIVSSISTPQMSTDMKDEFNLMHNQMNSKFSELHQLINYDMVGNHIELTTYIFNVKRELQQKIKMVEECVGMLMLDNPIINQVLDLQEENQNLRKQLNDAMNRGSK